MNIGLDLMADYVYLSKYAQRKPDGTLETWNESVSRIYAMHRVKLRELYGEIPEMVEELLSEAEKLEQQRMILGSQRARQFASTLKTSGILKHESKIYNCTATFIDRVDAFSEIMYLLLSGCGVGYSLHQAYIQKLPVVQDMTDFYAETFVAEDSIEGWADSIKYLITTLYAGQHPRIDLSKIRPEGSLIDGKFQAPGPEPLARAHKNIEQVFAQAQGRKLTSLEVHDVLCYIAESVVCGGVRRSAMIALFDKTDRDMLTAKTGSWWVEHPQRAMANNSILCTYDDPMTYDEYKSTIAVIRQFGEPGFVIVPSYEYMVNPCAEIVMRPISPEKQTGFAFCNLVEINAEKCDTTEKFYHACRVASFLGTVQSLYTDFKYIGNASKSIAVHDRNIGVSITGIYANPLLRGEVLRNGARVVATTNSDIAQILNINTSRTCTTVKPSGNASSILGLSCSGIHPAHAETYLRRIRIKTNSPEYIALQDTPLVKNLRGSEAVISFPIHVDQQGVQFKDDVSAIDHLRFISEVKHYWINKGSMKRKQVNHNISATVEVRDNEWEEVAAVLYVNQHLYTGVSLLPKHGDQIYDNAPFTRVNTPETLAEYNAIVDYLRENDVDFLKIMSNRENIHSGDLAAIACAGGSCELK